MTQNIELATPEKHDLFGIAGALDDLCEMSHNMAKEKGWWETDRKFPECIALISTENSEAFEEYRQNGEEGLSRIYTYDEAGNMQPLDDEGQKPEGAAVEFADEIIRICDTCKRFNIPLGEALVLKMNYNATRPHRHGGKHA